MEGGAVTELVVVNGRGNAAEGEEVVVFEFRFVFAQAHLFDAEVEGEVGVFVVGERVLGLLFVVDVDVGEALAGLNEVPKVLRLDKGDARQLAAQIGGVGFAVAGVVKQGVDVVEDVPLGDFGFLIWD